MFIKGYIINSFSGILKKHQLVLKFFELIHCFIPESTYKFKKTNNDVLAKAFEV